MEKLVNSLLRNGPLITLKTFKAISRNKYTGNLCLSLSKAVFAAAFDMVRHGSTWFDKLTNRSPTAHQPLRQPYNLFWKSPKLNLTGFKNQSSLVSGIRRNQKKNLLSQNKFWTPQTRIGVQNLFWMIGIFVSFVGCSSVPPEPTPPDVTKIPPMSNPTNTAGFSDFLRPTAPVRKTVRERKKVPSQRGNLNQAALRKPISIRGYVEQGRASWYSVKQHGAKTASGQLYDLYGMTAAHATLPLMSRVRVKNLRTGRHVIVTINDRLYNSNVLIKLSYWSARYLGVVKRPSQTLEIRGI